MAPLNKRFPRVWRNAQLQAVAIVYHDRVEYYWTRGNHGRQTLRRVDDSDKIFKPYRAEEMLVGEGFKRVHFLEATGPVEATMDALNGAEIDDGRETSI